MINTLLNNKRLTALILSAVLLTGGPGMLCTTARAMEYPETVSETTEEASSDVSVDDRVNHLTVGVTTPLDGCFFTELWGRRTTDIDMRYLLHSYDLVRWNGKLGFFEMDPAVVSAVSAMENEAGDRRYVISLQNDLFYSDGTRITAWDYAFSVLFEISPQVAELGGIPADKKYLLGCEEYLDEENVEVTALAGVRVLAEDTLAITIRHEYLPFFYELGLLDCVPYPVSVLAPGVTVRDDGEGVYLANEVEDADGDGIKDELLYTAELLNRTIFDPETGYMNHPSVVSGPYTMVSWDGTTAELERNPFYKDYAAYRRILEMEHPTGEGDPEIVRKTVLDENAPFIERLTVLYVDDNTAVDLLARGDIDLVNKVTKAETIQQGILLVGDRERYGEFGMSNYPRNGLSYVSYCCEREELTLAVRQAMAFCMDREAVVSDYTAGFGMQVNGFYGVGQWMVRMVNGTIPFPLDPPEDGQDEQAQAKYEADLAAWQELNLDGLNPYTLDIEAAAELLEADGWVMNEETGIREKHLPLEETEEETSSESSEEIPEAEEVTSTETSGTVGMPSEETGEMFLEEKERILTLDLTLAYPINNKISESLEENWIPYLEEAGIRLTLLPMDYNEMMRLYYGWDDRSETEIDMFYLASNFDILFDPLVYFSIKEEKEPEERESDESAGEEALFKGDQAEMPENSRLKKHGKISWSYTGFEDPELYRLAVDMRMTEPEDILGYVQKWIAFQNRFNEQLPILPIYSNVYFDFYTSELHNYAVSENVSWTSRVTDARMYREERKPEETTEDGTAEESGETEDAQESTEEFRESGEAPD